MGAGGRPSKYDPKYCEMLIEHMAEGLSFESFAGVIGVGRSSLYDWENEYPEFSDAKMAGQAKSALFWEKLNRGHAAGKIKSGSANAIFTMKCRFGWKDQANEQQDININLNYNLNDE